MLNLERVIRDAKENDILEKNGVLSASVKYGIHLNHEVFGENFPEVTEKMRDSAEYDMKETMHKGIKFFCLIDRK